MNLVEIGLVVLEIWKTEFGSFTVPVNNTVACYMPSFSVSPLGRSQHYKVNHTALLSCCMSPGTKKFGFLLNQMFINNNWLRSQKLNTSLVNIINAKIT